MMILERIWTYFHMVFHLAADPLNILILLSSVLMGIMFGAMPGLTSTLGVALLTALTYGMDTPTAMLCLLSIYVGGTYGGSYASILINIPGTAAAAARSFPAVLAEDLAILFGKCIADTVLQIDQKGFYGTEIGAIRHCRARWRGLEAGFEQTAAVRGKRQS